MLKLISQNFTPQLRNEGGPVRKSKLAAAARAVMEPVESRLLYSVSPATVLNQQVSTITANFETPALAQSGEAASGTTIWVNPTDATQSTVIGADKLGALTVYDLSGNQIQSITDSSYFMVDNHAGFALGGQSVSLVAADRVESNSLALFSVDPTTRQLTDVTAGTIKLSNGGTMAGLAMYQSKETGKTYVFVSDTTGSIEQFELTDNGSGQVSATSVRTINVGSSAQRMTADDETGALYVSQTGVAIWKYGAEPTDGAVRTEIDNRTTGYVGTEAESLALYKSSDGSGYLIASRQNSNDYVVYDRQTGAYVTKFQVTTGTVDGTSSSDDIAVTSSSLGSGLDGGAFVAEDDRNDNGNQNFKIVSWGDIARAQSIPLAIDSAQVAAPEAPADPATSTLSVDSLSLYQANTDNKLVNIRNGSVISLADFQGTDLNLRANTTGAVGSVVFGVNGTSNYHTENFESYEIAGTGGVWAPTAGTYTITATAYSEHYGKGTVSQSYTTTFTVVDGGTSTSNPTDTDATTAPAAVTKLSAAPISPASISLKWTAGDKLADTYRIERSTDGGTTFKQIALATSTSYLNTGLTVGTKYTYRVTAYNSAGDSDGVLVSATAATVTLPVDLSIVSNLLTVRPSATNTGVQAGTTLKSVTASSVGFRSNTSYSGLRITGQVTITGMSNITFTDCVFDNGNTSMWGIRCDNCTNITIKNCEIKGASAAGIYGSGFKAINNYIHQIAGDGIKPNGDAVIEGNYITQLGWYAPGAHADGIQISGGSNVRIAGNYFDMPEEVANTKSNSSVFVQGAASNIVIDGNWMRGGNFSIHAYADGSGGSSVKITNNVYYAGSAQYGFASIASDIVWLSNKTESGLAALAGTK